MKRIFQFYFLFFSINNFAQTLIPIGSGTDSTIYGPIYNYSATTTYNHSWNTTLYDNTELFNAGAYTGDILGVSWFYTDTTGYHTPDGLFEIYIKHTSYQEFLSGINFYNEVGNATLVYSNPAQEIPSGPRQMDFNFQTPFVWNGIDNIMILTKWVRQGSFTGRIHWRSSLLNQYKTTFTISTDSTTTNGFTSKSRDRANIIFHFAPQSSIDVSMISLDSLPGHCAGSVDVYSSFKNFGSSTLNSVQINWEVNGILQTPVNFNGSLNYLDSSQILLGNITLSSGIPQTIRAWSSNPNGFLDTINANDTVAYYNLLPGLNGIYTIGSGASDFQTVKEAAVQLNNNGVCGPVEFHILPGNYSEKIILKSIANTSSSNTILFRSSISDSSSVILETPSLQIADSNFTVLIENCNYISIEHLTISRSGSNDNSIGIKLQKGSSHVRINNCRIIGSSIVDRSGTFNGAQSGIFTSETSPWNDLNLSHNYFQGNAYGLWLAGDSSDFSDSILIKENQFENGYTSIFITQSVAPIISENIINRNDSISDDDYYGIHIFQATGPVIISKNRITSFKGNYGIRLRECLGDSVNRIKIVNNFVQAGANGIGQCIGLNGLNYHIDVLHNNLNFTGSDHLQGKAIALELAYNRDVRLMNNVFCNSGGGFSVYLSFQAISSISYSDYNCHYSTGDTLTFYDNDPYLTLTDFRNATTFDSNSITANPFYFSNNDLHTLAGALDKKGTFLAAVIEDIDGEIRDTLNPDIGADEFLAVNIKPDPSNNLLKFYPNPCSDKLWIDLENFSGNYKIEVIDISGRLVVSESMIHSKSALDITSISNGTYIMRLIGDILIYSGLIIKN